MNRKNFIIPFNPVFVVVVVVVVVVFILLIVKSFEILSKHSV